jgi:predicted nucleic acid-binding protein
VTFLLDVNLLMALLWENHEHHRLARAWLARATDFATCPVSHLGFARVSSPRALDGSAEPLTTDGDAPAIFSSSNSRFSEQPLL